MNTLNGLKIQRVRIDNVKVITSSLQLVATTQSTQLLKKRKNYRTIREQSMRLIEHLGREFDLSTLTTNKSTLHIILSCDQKFCKNFLVGLNEFLITCTFDSSDTILLFGSRSLKVLEATAPGSQIVQYRSLSTFDEAESIAHYIYLAGYPRTYIYSYIDLSKSFQKVRLIPFPSYDDGVATKFEVTSLTESLHFFLASEIYYHAVQTGLKERIERAMAMSEASSNAETKSRELTRLYNQTRQSMITKEITSGS